MVDLCNVLSHITFFRNNKLLCNISVKSTENYTEKLRMFFSEHRQGVTPPSGGVTDIVGLSMQSDLYYTHFFKCSHSPPMLAIPHFLYMNFDISVCFIADFPHYSWKANKNQKCSL